MIDIILSQQKFCCGKHTFVMMKDMFCHDKHIFVVINTCLSQQSFVATKMVLVAAPTNAKNPVINCLYTTDFYVDICTLHVCLKLSCKTL